jgi:YjbE family integral membrane protein
LPTDFLQIEALSALASVIVIDIALAGDNAIVVGMAAGGLPAHQRRHAIVIGIAAAAVLRIVFAAFTTQLLQVIGLLLAGGLLLLWVAWKLWREIRGGHLQEEAEAEAALDDEPTPAAPEKTFREAVMQIVIADVSMSLDNVLAVAGAARDHWHVLVIGLALSVALMGLAASLIAHLLRRYPAIAYFGLAIIVYVALKMIWDGGLEVMATI